MTLGACCLPEEKTIPPGKRVPDAGVLAAETSRMPEAKLYTPPADWQPSEATLALQNCKKSAAPDWVSTDPAGVEVSRHGLFEYCWQHGGQPRPCNTWCAPGDLYAGWWCDNPLPWQVQLMSEDGTCYIMGCDTYQPEVGFNAGGYGDVSALFGLSSVRWQRNGNSVNTVHFRNECWSGQAFPTWGWGELDWGPDHPWFLSFACSNQVGW